MMGRRRGRKIPRRNLPAYLGPIARNLSLGRRGNSERERERGLFVGFFDIENKRPEKYKNIKKGWRKIGRTEVQLEGNEGNGKNGAMAQAEWG